jgi:cell division protein FtsL
MRVKRVLVFTMAVTIPVFLFLNAWQGYKYGRLAREIRRMEAEQKNWFEENKKLIASIAIFSSPSRIDRSAREELGLSKPESRDIDRIHIRGDERE